MNHVFFSKEQYNTLLSTGSVTVSGVTYNYDPDNNIYYTPSEHKVCHHFIQARSGDYYLTIPDFVSTNENPINTPTLLRQAVCKGLIVALDDDGTTLVSTGFIKSVSDTAIVLNVRLDSAIGNDISFPINTSTTVTDVVSIR